ncbi:hypothetical protein VTP01DRAFT_3965 [Rhizomucor pusillus]|uniref:uncharacterized protein n=1 Tax=Rhizomucor pusillus TaxID=4840 RepID=UPI0037443109
MSFYKTSAEKRASISMLTSSDGSARRWFGMPSRAPPPTAQKDRANKPGRLSIAGVSMTSLSSSSSPSPTSASSSPRSSMRRRLSSFFSSTSPIRLVPERPPQVLEEEEKTEIAVDAKLPSPPPSPPVNTNSRSPPSFSSPDIIVPEEKPIPPRQQLDLAHTVRAQLGNVFQDIDGEIEREWEVRRKDLQRSLMI